MQKQAFFLLHKREELNQMSSANFFTHFLLSHCLNTFRHFYIFKVDTVKNRRSQSLERGILQLSISPYLTHHCCLRLTFKYQHQLIAQMSNCQINTEPDPPGRHLFSKLHLHASLVNLFHQRNRLETNNKEERDIPSAVLLILGSKKVSNKTLQKVKKEG